MSYKKILTKKGLEKLASASPEDQLQITHIAVGDGSGGYPSLDEDATSLNNEVYRTEVKLGERHSGDLNVLPFWGIIPSDVGDFTIREVALFDIYGDMISIAQTSETEKKLGSDALNMGFNLKVANETESNETESNGYNDHSLITGRKYRVIDFFGGSLPDNDSVGEKITYNQDKSLSLLSYGYGIGGVPSKMTVPQLLDPDVEEMILSVVVYVDQSASNVFTVFQQLGVGRIDITMNGGGSLSQSGIGSIFGAGKNTYFTININYPMSIVLWYYKGSVYFIKDGALIDVIADVDPPTGLNSTLMGNTTTAFDAGVYLLEARAIYDKCDISTLKTTISRIKSKFGISSDYLFAGHLGIPYKESVYCAMTIDGKMLIENNSNFKESPASITKMMTLFIASQHLDLDEILTVIEADIRQDSLLSAGDNISVRDAMYAAMLLSSNTSATLLGRYCGDKIDGGGITSFVSEMNRAALIMGASQTNFVNANGIYNNNQYSTVKDQCIIGTYVARNIFLMRVMSSSSATININDTQSNINSTVENIGRNGVIGGKTGTISSPTVGTYNLINFVQGESGVYIVCSFKAPNAPGRFVLNDFIVDGLKKSSSLGVN